MDGGTRAAGQLIGEGAHRTPSLRCTPSLRASRRRCVIDSLARSLIGPQSARAACASAETATGRAPEEGTCRIVLRDGRRATYGRRVGATRGFARPDTSGRGAGNRGVRRRRTGWRTRVGVALMTAGAVLAGCTATEAVREVIPTP